MAGFSVNLTLSRPVKSTVEKICAEIPAEDTPPAIFKLGSFKIEKPSAEGVVKVHVKTLAWLSAFWQLSVTGKSMVVPGMAWPAAVAVTLSGVILGMTTSGGRVTAQVGGESLYLILTGGRTLEKDERSNNLTFAELLMTKFE